MEASKLAGSRCHLDLLPEELLLKVFAKLAELGPSSEADTHTQNCSSSPFGTSEATGDPHPGLRSYPFLAQVCRRWKSVLADPISTDALWQDVVVDFGHELVTAVHTPLTWSDKRPTDEEFRHSFAHTKLSAKRIIDFVKQRQHCVRRLVLMNSEGYWSDDGDFMSLNQKHNFTMAHFGMLIGMMQNRLEELRVQHCNDFFAVGQGALSALACLPRLRKLAVEDVHGRVERESLAELAQLTQLEQLSITAEEHVGSWAVGIDKIPGEWKVMRGLRRLELRGHTLLAVLPDWLASLPLEHLDVSHCRNVELDSVAALAQLRTLVLQGLDLHESAAEGAPPPSTPGRRLLPALGGLTRLTALSLADNCLTRVPPALAKLKALRHLDLSGNLELKVGAPLAVLGGLGELRLVDLRKVHEEPGLGYWSEAKCATMRHLATAAKQLKRRAPPARLLLDLE